MAKRALEHLLKSRTTNRIRWEMMNSRMKTIRAMIAILKLVRRKLLLKLDWTTMLRLKTWNQRWMTLNPKSSRKNRKTKKSRK